MAAPIIHIEFRSSDFARTAAFYSKLFDWETQQNATSTYMKLDASESPSAGWVRAEFSQAPGPLAYIAVDDLTATLAEIEKAGGRVIVAKMPFTGGGEIALFADPDGNVVGLWARKEKAPGALAPAPTGKMAAAAVTPKPAPAKTAAVVKTPPAKVPDKKAKKR